MTRQIIIDETQYPANNKKASLERVLKEEPEKRKIIKGGARLMKKERNFETLFSTFVSDTLGQVGQYILRDVLIPAAKSTLQEIVTSGIEMMLYGSTKPRSGSGHTSQSGKTFISYDRAYPNAKREVITAKPRGARFDFTNIIFQHGGEAADVLEQMCADLEEFEAVSVNHFYELAGVDAGTDYTANGWGWKDLSSAFCEPVRGGYQIVLPRPVELD